jgi:hypothetical protein
VKPVRAVTAALLSMTIPSRARRPEVAVKNLLIGLIIVIILASFIMPNQATP